MREGSETRRIHFADQSVGARIPNSQQEAVKVLLDLHFPSQNSTDQNYRCRGFSSGQAEALKARFIPVCVE